MRAKYILFAFIGLMLAYVLYHNESFLIDSAHPAWKHYAGIKWTLLPHGVALWLLATGVAFWCIRQRRIEQHRQWMMRSFAMALVFLEGRLILGVTGWEDLGIVVSETVIWCCIAFAYPLADLVLLIDERLRGRSSAGLPSPAHASD